MEYGSRLRFALLTIGGILLLVLSIWGVTSLARRVIGGDDTKKTTQTKKIDLATYNKESSFIRLTVKGPVVASEKYQSYQIEVGQNYRELKIFKGYNGETATEQRYSNDSTAYEALLKSLKRYNFTSKKSDFGNDETGYCATGKRYIYELFDHGNLVQRTWNTSCGTTTGTFNGSGTSSRSLLKKQIPEFTKLTEKLSI